MYQIIRPAALLRSTLLLLVVGWGGLAVLFFFTEPLVWPRWFFYLFWFAGLTGAALPVTYFLNLRFPTDPPAEAGSILRQAMWFGVFGSLVAWLQLGRVMAFWIWIGLPAALGGAEYLFRLRERARWRPPFPPEESPFVGDPSQIRIRSDRPGADD